MTDFELIENYFDGQLTTEELMLFEKRTLSDIDFKKEVEVYRNSIMALQNHYKHEKQRNSLSQTLSEKNNIYFKSSNNSIFSRKHIAIISSIAAVLLIGFFLFNNQSLYEEYGSHQALKISLKGDQNTDLLEGVTHFNNHRHVEAINKFEYYLRSNPQDLQIQMSLGISLLETNQYEKALSIFNNSGLSESVFKDKAQWFGAMTYLKMKDFKLCKKHLLTIDSDSKYYHQAQELLEEI